MEAIAFLVVLLIFGLLVVAVVMTILYSNLRGRIDVLTRRIQAMESHAISLPEAPPSPAPATSPPRPVPIGTTSDVTAAKSAAAPPPLPTAIPISPAVAPAMPKAKSNWESIVGVKLFAWIGGLALFLGVIFFVKYAFENNLITPAMRIIAGAIIGLSLTGLAAMPGIRRYRVPAQSLCATGILILYADIYAAHSFYHLIPLSAASVFMWIVTGGALFLAGRLDAQSAAWLAVVGGFLTPFLLWTRHQSAVALFGYVAVLNVAVALVGALKRWTYLLLLAAAGSIIVEFGWAIDLFGPGHGEAVRVVFLLIEAEFIAICIVLSRGEPAETWSMLAAAAAGLATIFFCWIAVADLRRYQLGDIFLMLLLGNAGLVALAVAARPGEGKWKQLAAILASALALTWFAEWAWHRETFENGDTIVVTWYAALYLLFAAAPFFCGINRLWPWMLSAIAGPLQFWLVYRFLVTRFDPEWRGLIPLAFAIPAAVGVTFLVKKERVPIASGDSRLATQGAAFLAFISLVFPVQFQKEWITVGWAIEGLALVLLYHWLPNRRLRVVAIIALSAAFVRLIFNSYAFDHVRTGAPFFNRFLYAYGVAAVCFLLSARYWGEPRERMMDRVGPRICNVFAVITCFILMNVEIADYFSVPVLASSFDQDFARDMTYTIAWALFAFGLLAIGIWKNVRAVRFASVALFCLSLAKLFLHDLASLSQLYRIGAFITVAVICIVASFAYQRFLQPGAARR